MPSYNLSVLGLEVSFKAEADPQRVQDAKNLVEERYKQLEFPGRQISKEKLLTFLALGLADDLLQSDQDLTKVEARLERLLTKIDGL
jgi:cell division protein ZapA